MQHEFKKENDLNKILQKIRNIPKGVKSSVAFFIASMVSVGMAYIVTPIYTRIMSSEEFGQVSVFMTWLSIFGIIAMFCLSYGVFNNGMLDYKTDRDGYSLSMLALSNTITIVFSIILISVYPLIEQFINIDLPLIGVMILVFLTQPAYNFYLARKRYEYEYKPALIASIIIAILSPSVAIVAILTTSGSKVYARILGAELAFVAVYLVFYIIILIKGKFKINVSYWTYALKFNFPLIPHYLSIFLLDSVNKIMISKMVNDSATAYYSVASSVASIATIAWSAVNASLIPYTYEKCSTKDYKSISKITIPILTLFAGISLIVIMLAPEVVAIMATADYWEAIYVIPPVVAGVFLKVQYFIYANIVYYHKKPKYVMYASLVAVIFNIGLNIVFIKLFGYLAAGYVTLIAYLIQATLNYFAMKKVVKEKVYNMRFIGILTGVVIFIAILSNLIYDFAIIRYLLLIVTLAIAFIFRKRIIQIFSLLRKEA